MVDPLSEALAGSLNRLLAKLTHISWSCRRYRLSRCVLAGSDRPSSNLTVSRYLLSMPAVRGELLHVFS